MKIRRGTLDDALALATIHIRARREGYADFMPPQYLDSLSIEDEEQFWRTRLSGNKPNATTIIAEVDGRIAGYLRYIVDGAEGEVELLHIDPDYWRAGVGSGLLAEAESAMAETGASHAWLNVYRDNARGRSFYEKNGWVYEREVEYQHRTGFPVHQARYTKRWHE